MPRTLMVLVSGLLLTPLSAKACTSVGHPSEIDAVQARRAAFNEAIRVRDIDTIAATLHENVILVTGTASEVHAGRAAQLLLWRGDFESANRAVYVRTTDCVRVSGVFPVALESGHWRGERESDARNFAAGAYAAKWRLVDGAWLLEAELFSTEACGGEFCPQQDDSAR